MWQGDRLRPVAGIEGTVESSLTSTTDTESYKPSLFSPLSLVGHLTMPSHGPTIHETAPSELRAPLSTQEHIAEDQLLKEVACAGVAAGSMHAGM